MRREADTNSVLIQNGRVSILGKDFNVLSLYPAQYFKNNFNFMEGKEKEVLFMKARKSILGLLLIIGMLFSCAAISYAEEATKAPKITTSKLEAGEHGGTYSQTIEVENNLDEDGNYTNLTITSAATTALEKYGITVTTNDNGSLTLATEDGATLVSPTSGYKFTVNATNKWRKKETDNFTTGTAKKDFTLKITGIAPEIVSPDAETYSEISSLAAPENYSYPVKGTAITDVPFTTNEASPKVVMTATGLPKGLSFKATTQPTTGEPAATTYTLSGTPTETGTFKIKIKAENADKKGTGISKSASETYTLNVLDTPGLTPTSFKDATFGKSTNQKFTVTGVSKAVSLTSADVGVYDGDTFTALSDTDYGLTGTYENGKFTISGAVTSYDFGEASTATIPIVFRMTSPAMSDPTEVTMNLKVLATAPVFTNKSEAQTAVSSLTKGEEITSFDVIATGPGTITWTVSDLPDGLTSTSADPTVDGTTSTIKISGTPAVTAKGFPVDITAKNAKGSTTITLKFTIDGEAPVISMVPDVTTSEDEPAYAQLGVNSGDVDITMSADSGPVTWKVTKLPKGINFILTDADGKTVTTKTSQYAKIKGKATAAMKDTDVVTVTATDPNTRKSSDTLELNGLHVYPVPTIKTKKFSDVKIGSEYSSVIKAEGVTSWTVETDYGDNEFPEGLTLDSSDASNLTLSGQLDTIPTSGDKLITKISVKLTAEGPGGKASLTIPLNIKGTAPKFATSSLANTYTKAGSESNTISVTGTKPMTFNAYIAVKDATAAGITTTTNLVISTDAENPEANTGFYLSSEDVDGGYTLTLAKTAGTGGSFKNLGVTIEADNGLGTKATTKVFKATMTGEAPVWYLVDADDETNLITLSDDFLANPVVNFTAKKADAVNMTFKASGDAPMTLTVSPSTTTAGLTITTSSDAKTVTVAATRSAEAKSTKVTMTAKNGDGTSKLVVTFNGQEAPVIKVPTGGYVKTVEQGKKLSLALSLESGTKPVTWGFAELEDGDETYITSSDLESKYGITLDTSKGKLEGTPETVTLSTDETTYAPVVVKVYAMNAAGSDDVDVTIGVTGGKPKLSTKTLEIDKNEELPEDGYLLAADGLASSDVTWKIQEKNGKKKLSNYVTGLELGEDGLISGDPTASIKNASVPVIMSHFGTEATGTVKISVYDPTPVIALEKEEASVDLYPTADSNGKVAAAVSTTLPVLISNDCVATGASKITWKATKPGGNVTVKIENGNTNDSRFNKAKLTITLPKGKGLTLTSGDTCIEGYTTTFDLTATNSGRTTEKTDTVTITVRVAGGDGAITDKNGNIVETDSALKDTMIGETKVLEEDIVTNDDLTAELGEGELTLGADRTLEMLTAGQAAVLDEGRFVIAAILPEISATADGQYGLEVDLADTVKPGAKLYWFAFPKDAPDSEDDQIADFFDIEGADTEVVPNDHIVIVYPWLREGVTYGPVIAVKAEDAESGEAVTEGELEEAAEGEETSATTEVEAPAGEAAE